MEMLMNAGGLERECGHSPGNTTEVTMEAPGRQDGGMPECPYGRRKTDQDQEAKYVTLG